jgi:hypothetical protein
MRTRIAPAPRRLVFVGIALVLVTAVWVRPAHAAESKEVIVVNTPTVDARQLGRWDVGIDRVRIPFQKLLNFLIPDGEDVGTTEFVVPAGHRLVIEQVTAALGLFPGQVSSGFKVTTVVGGDFAEHYIPVTSAYGGSFVGCQQVRLYADPETTVRFVAFRTGHAGAVVLIGSISGYLIPTP